MLVRALGKIGNFVGHHRSLTLVEMSAMQVFPVSSGVAALELDTHEPNHPDDSADRGGADRRRAGLASAVVKVETRRRAVAPSEQSSR